ncbi:hypothetical protein G6F59_012940 [Rhizopus arrhizus]|nr:hypothetical protein G6F59_012940 [Rhizopus arrhizus]
MGRAGTASAGTGTVGADRPAPPHRLRTPVPGCLQRQPHAVRARRRSPRGLGMDRQRRRCLEGSQAAAGTLPRRPVGPGQRNGVPAAGRGCAGQWSLGMSVGSQPVLVADIGGTNARFALADTSLDAPLLKDSIREYAVAEFPSLGDAARHHLEQIGASAGRGVFAVAGRVDGDEARITNHPWVISRSRTAAMLGFDELHLINDFAAQAMAISLLQPEDVIQVGGAAWVPGKPGQPRNYAVIGPGTGLGVGGLILRHGRCYPLETEGGHVSFPPGTPEEIRILEILSEQFGRVSNERLICGPGLVNIHRAVCEMAGIDPGQLQPVDVTARALHGDPQAMRTVDVFCAVFGAIAGDLVLTQGAWDGVFLTGGLTPKMLDSLQHSGFRQRFEHKGRFSSIMARVPSLAVMHPHAGLLGAAAYAADAARAAPGVAA